jgi:transcriptional regulator GlxA family with amidase domain
MKSSLQGTVPIHIFFVLLPQTTALDWAGPAEAFRIANQSLARLGEPERFVMHHVGPARETVSSPGLVWSCIEPLPATLAPHSWVFLLGQPDEALNQHASERRTVTHWLRSISRQLKAPSRLVTVCAGALIAAEAGLLAHTRATTHHLELDALQKAEPHCEVQRNCTYVIDRERNVYSSAGITTGIDLAVHMITETCGELIAARVAQVMVMPLRRGPNEPELSPFLKGRHHLHPAIHKLQDAITQQPQLDWTASRMADVVHTSPRHLARLFSEHVGQSPTAYLRSVRLALANKALQSGHSSTQAAELAGFHSSLQLRRARTRFSST